jgi:hypothetical protein
MPWVEPSSPMAEENANATQSLQLPGATSADPEAEPGAPDSQSALRPRAPSHDPPSQPEVLSPSRDVSAAQKGGVTNSAVAGYAKLASNRAEGKDGPFAYHEAGVTQIANERRKGDEDENELKYRDVGVLSRIAKSSIFDNGTLAIISVNAGWIGMNTFRSFNDAEDLTTAPFIVQIGENIFCIYFTIEVFIRWFAYKHKLKGFLDAWLMFDSFLVFFMVAETWFMPLLLPGASGAGLSVLRLLRLARLTRMARLMRRVPELLTLLKGMVAAVRSVSSALLLLLLITYVFSIIFATVLGGDPTYYDFWGTIPFSMYTLGVIGAVGDDSTAFMYDPEAEGKDIWHEHPTMLWVFLAYFFLANFTVLNMLIGILCDVISDTQASEKMKAKVREVEDKISLVYDSIDVDGSGKISAHEFDMIKNLDEVQEALSDLGILPNQFIALRDTLFNVEDEDSAGASSRRTRPREVKLNVDPEILDKADAGVGSSSKPGKRTSISTASLNKLQAAIEERQTMQNRDADDPTREIDFDEFIRICVSQRPENDMSVMDMNEIRKTARLGIRRIEKRTSFLLSAVKSLPKRKEFELACINILKPLVAAAQELKGEWTKQNKRANAAAQQVAELQEKIRELEALPTDGRPPRRKQPPHNET